MIRICFFIVITVVIAIAVDNIRFNYQLSEFISPADDLLVIYDLVCKTLINEDLDVEFVGEVFYLYVKSGDYKSLIDQVELAIFEVLDKYDLIDERYFIEMDDDTLLKVETMHKDVEDIYNEIRMLKWKNGWN